MRYLAYLIIFGLMQPLLSGCSTGYRAFSKGQQFETEGKYEDAMYSYADAFREEPESSEYRLRFLNARDTAANLRYKKGGQLSERGEYAAALAEYQTAFALDPTQELYKQRIEVVTRLKYAQQAFQEGIDFEKTNKLKDANRSFAHAIELSPENKEYKAALERVSGLRKNKLEGYELSLKSAKPITLKFKDAKIKDVFNIITQLSGINFIFDDTVKDQPVTIYLENATFQQTLELLTSMFKLGRKVANESTVIIYPKTPEKIKQYEDMQLRTFHLNYMEAKKAVNLIRTMIQVRKIYVNEDSNSVVVRDTGDVVDVIEKILDANDVPDPEVVLDVEVIEISDTNTQRLGLLLSPYSVQLGAYSPSGNLLGTTLSSTSTSSTSSSGTTTTETAITNLVRAFSMSGYSGYVTVPNATYNFAKTLSKGEVLSNPKIRVKNKEKSKFTVGTRLPITTSNTTNSTVSVNVQYVDVGVKVNAEPTIQLNNEIVIKLSLEVSQQVGAARDVGGGTSVVTIGTRNLETVLSLKDGETSIIGGLIQKTTGDDKNKLLFLSDIPLIGPLFTDSNYSRTKSELMLAITPRLVRGVVVPEGELMSFSSGKEDDPSLVRPLAAFDQEPVFETAPKNEMKKPVVAPAQNPGGAVRPVAPPQGAPVPAAASPVPAPAPASPAPTPLVPVSTSPAPVSTPLTPVSAPSAPVPAGQLPEAGKTTQGVVSEKQLQNLVQPSSPAPAASGAAAATTAAVNPAVKAATPAPQQRGVLQITAPSSISLGQQFSLDIKASNINDLSAASFVLTYNPVFVEFISAGQGNLLKSDGKPATFSNTADKTGGAVTINQARGAGNVGVSGNGNIATAVFRARNKGAASFGFRNVNFTAVDGKPMALLPFSTAVDVR